MIRKGIVLLVLLAMSVWVARAYDFSVTLASGQTLYFNLVDGGAEVTHPADASAYADGWKSYDKPEGSLTIPTYVSYGDTTYAVVSVGLAAFYKCDALTSITLSEGIERIDGYAFNYCSKISEIHLPSTLQSVDNQTFANLTALADLWIAATLPPTTHTYTFYNTSLGDCTLHVDCGSLDDYTSTLPWSGFDTVVSDGCKVTITAKANSENYGTVSGSGVYDAGTLVTLAASPKAGYLFTCWDDADTNNPRIVSATADSTFIAIFIPLSTDSTTKTDTVFITVYDTVTLADTIYVAVPVHDTVTLHDTIYYAVPTHDTIFITDITHDTVTLYDTVMPTFFNVKVQSDNPQLGIGVGSALLPAGIEVEVCGLPLEGARFLSWDDGSTQNPRRLTVNGALVLTAYFEHVSVDDIMTTSWHTQVDGLRLTLSGAAGETMRLYDTQGRRLAEMDVTSDRLTIDLPATGIYLLQVGDSPARRIMANKK